MNNGKICIPVCAATADQVIAGMKRADELADVVEVRFDCLLPGELDLLNPRNSENTLGRILNDNPVTAEILMTLRPAEQGGKRTLTLEERRDFWGSGFDHWGADLEEDVFEESWHWLYGPRICSHHDFHGTPENIGEIYKRIASIELVDVIKIAVQANDITDTIRVWKLLQRAKAENRKIIPIAMGEAGKWTRILGGGHGAYMTYAALETGSETAPGQISAEDLLNVYRVKELDGATVVYGIIAGDTSYSVSPYLHNPAFRAAGLNSVFVPLQVADLDAFIRRMVKPETREIDLNFKGFAVTNPHKQAILTHLDEVDDAARAIGAVNTVTIDAGKLYGFNTDAAGFLEPLKRKYGAVKGASVAVIGAGGAARACVYALSREGADVTVLARDPAKAAALGDDFGVSSRLLKFGSGSSQFDIVVNTTPLGTKGAHETETIARAEDLGDVKLVYDLVYNPTETLLLKEAKAAGAETLGGLEMLIDQGVRQFEIWTGHEAPAERMKNAVRQRLGL